MKEFFRENIQNKCFLYVLSKCGYQTYVLNRFQFGSEIGEKQRGIQKFGIKNKKLRYGQGEGVFKISDLCCFTSGQEVRYEFKHEEGNQGDMEKIHVTQHFFAASGPQGHFFENKNHEPVVTCVLGKCVVFRLVRRSRTDRHTNLHTYDQHYHLHTWIFDI